MALHVYGIVRARHPEPRDRAGIGSPPAQVRLVRSGDLAAAVSDVEPDRLTERDAVRHLDVLIGLLADGPVLPLRFGTVAPDEDTVRRQVLDATAMDLADRLDKLDGMVEVRLDISVDEDAELRVLLDASPALRHLAGRAAGTDALTTRIEIGEQISSLLAARRTMLDDLVITRLGPLSTADLRSPTEEVTALCHVFLIEADRLDRFDEAVGQLRDELGDAYAVEYVGPLPAFDFIDIQIKPPHLAPARWGW